LVYWSVAFKSAAVYCIDSGCSSCAVEAAQEGRRSSYRVQEGFLSDLFVNFD